MRYKIILISCICLQLFSCNNIVKNLQELNEDEESAPFANLVKVKFKNLYSLRLPDYMKEMKNLHPEASLQYANIYKDIYTIVIHEDKEEFISIFKDFGEYDDQLDNVENYMNFQKAYISENLNNSKTEEYGLTKINGMPARQVKILGKVEDVDVGYITTTIEGENNMYLIMSWTSKSKFKAFENTFENINGSLEILK